MSTKEIDPVAHDLALAFVIREYDTLRLEAKEQVRRPQEIPLKHMELSVQAYREKYTTFSTLLHQGNKN